MTDDSADADTSADLDAFYDAIERQRRPFVLAADVGDSSTDVAADLDELASDGLIERLDVSDEATVWFPKEAASADERITVFEKRREIVVDQPAQYTRALLTQFAHLADTNREGGYIYAVREEDVWNAPYETLTELLATVRSALGGRYDALEGWIEGQWERAHKFRLVTHEDGYVVLEAKSADLLGNIAEPRLDDGVLRARIGDATAWVADDRTADLKRTLYEAGYPVQDDRDLETGDDLPFDLETELRPYQTDWVERFRPPAPVCSSDRRGPERRSRRSGLWPTSRVKRSCWFRPESSRSSGASRFSNTPPSLPSRSESITAGAKRSVR